MLVFVARYAFVFWFLINGNNGENVFMRQMELEDQLRITVCTARCLQQQKQQPPQRTQPHASAVIKILYPNNKTLQTCFDLCRTHNATSFMPLNNTKKIHENFNLKLICRDDRSLTFRIDLEGQIAPDENSFSTAIKSMAIELEPNMAKPLRDTIYLIKVRNGSNVDVFLSDESFFTIGNLTHNTTHIITAMSVYSSNEYSVIAKEESFKTLSRGFTPGMVTDIHIKDFVIDAADDMRLMAQMTWKPSADMTCHYNILCFSPQSGDTTPLEIRDPRHLYAYTLENLTFSSKYSIGIRAKNPNNDSRESQLFWKTFRVPSCGEWYNYNFSICPPEEPAQLSVSQEFVRLNVYAFNISWKLPVYLPDHYTLRIVDLNMGESKLLVNISKDQNEYIISELIMQGPMYKVSLTAYTLGGHTTASLNDMLLVAVADQNAIVKLISAILAPLLCISILSLTIFIICHRRAKLKRYQERCKYFEELEKKAPIDPKATFDFPTKTLPLLRTPEDLTQFQLDLEEKIFFNDTMEINRNDVTLYEILGEGAFGLVRRGIYSDVKLGAREVAVKMLKDQPSIDDVRAFRREIEVMKSVERHPNIVGIIGHCSRRYNEMMLLTEYCSFGNLLNFLRNEWKYLYELQMRNKLNVISSHTSTRRSSKKRQPLQAPPQQEQYYIENIDNENRHNNDNYNSNSISQLDTTIVDKFRHKYKSVNGLEMHKNEAEDATVSHSSTLSAATENKSYGYDDICTNACKCQVNIISEDAANTADTGGESVAKVNNTESMSALQLMHTKSATKTVQVNNCECQQQLLVRKNEKNAGAQHSVENKAYFMSTTAAATSAAAAAEATVLEQRKPFTARGNNKTLSLAAGVCREPLTIVDLLDIAKQVAVGMEFLAKNKVVHRDLAARNVLVASDRTIKIADFGLSRDVYQENIYKKTGNGKLPIKWLALESMTHQVYTTQSDVWSYGILLYEIITLGGTPYPSIPTNRLLHLLKTGYRMEKPKNCGDEFYSLMYSCWNVSPAERPTFNEIIKILDNLPADVMQQLI